MKILFLSLPLQVGVELLATVCSMIPAPAVRRAGLALAILAICLVLAHAGIAFAVAP